MGVVPLHLLHRNLGRSPHPHGKHRRNSAAAQPPLLPPPVDDGLHAHAGAAADVERADALGAVDFVARNRGEVEVPLVDVDFDLAGGLGDVGVEENLVLTADLADLLHWLDDPDLVVDCHDTAQHSVGAYRGPQLVEVHDTVLHHGKVRDLETLLLEDAAGVEDALVLRLGGDDVLLLPLVEPRDALDRHVVALGRAARPDDLLRVRADQRPHARPCFLHGALCLPSKVVRPRVRVAILPGHEGEHGVEHAGVHGGGALVVQERRPPLGGLPRDAEVCRLAPRCDLNVPAAFASHGRPRRRRHGRGQRAGRGRGSPMQQRASDPLHRVRRLREALEA
mmetsp:Transcript_43067/g.84220  ORF Transcript_43067/g.84220 Transcript_43067/m.84220 type:complete len:337 (+) Transcript_43067:513-1523(+)